MKWPWGRKSKPAPSNKIVITGDDPLDPHGDGTLRPGDAMYEIFMGSMSSGKAIIANREDDGTWDWKEVP